MESLHRFDVVCTPRQANRIELYAGGARQVCDLMFGYDPKLVVADGTTPLKHADSVLFVGGADRDRIEIILPLCDSGLSVEVFGGYWHKLSHANLVNHGLGPPATLASATAQAAVNLILVRRANRDGHVMRSFEAAACGGCLLVEDTADHRRIYGETVAYFRTTAELIFRVKELLPDAERRKSLARACRQQFVTEGKHTYADRLQAVLSLGMFGN
jgi:spore maturation protein CgeB